VLRNRVSWVAQSATIIGRAHVLMLNKDPCQHLVGRIAYLEGNLGDWKVRLFEKFEVPLDL
jgi:hypothetical protein